MLAQQQHHETAKTGGGERTSHVHSRLERAKLFIRKTSSEEGEMRQSNEATPLPPSVNSIPIEETTEDVAHLLTEIAEIASKEAPLIIPTTAGSRTRKKIRAVSMASPDLRPHPTSPVSPFGDRFGSMLTSPSVTPPQSPNFRPPPTVKRTRPIQELSHDDEEEVTRPKGWIAQKLTLQPATSGGVGPRPKVTRKILHKKFSWKNYPELEEFLIANREEYLRHSTLNYTVQQKQYNNKLTERMLELAAECGYVFDEHDFSFVTVRDRIRCYYKSYVQSLKKRGIVIGYAARKAGLVTDDALEKSACKKGTIYVPSNIKH